MIIFISYILALVLAIGIAVPSLAQTDAEKARAKIQQNDHIHRQCGPVLDSLQIGEPADQVKAALNGCGVQDSWIGKSRQTVGDHRWEQWLLYSSDAHEMGFASLSFSDGRLRKLPDDIGDR
jgi:hypothetical protein